MELRKKDWMERIEIEKGGRYVNVSSVELSWPVSSLIHAWNHHFRATLLYVKKKVSDYLSLLRTISPISLPAP